MCEVSGKPDIEPDYSQIDDEDIDEEYVDGFAAFKIEDKKIIFLCGACEKPADVIETQILSLYCYTCLEVDKALLNISEFQIIPLVIKTPEV